MRTHAALYAFQWGGGGGDIKATRQQDNIISESLLKNKNNYNALVYEKMSCKLIQLLYIMSRAHRCFTVLLCVCV